MGAGKSKSISYSIGSRDTDRESSDTLLEQDSFREVYNLLDDAFYESFQENPEVRLRDMGIQLEWEGANYQSLRDKFKFLKDFSDEEIQFIVENYNGTSNTMSFNSMAYHSGELNNISDLEKGILEKYYNADLGMRESFDFNYNLDLIRKGGSSNSFKSFIDKLIKEGEGENINVGLSIKTLSILSKIGLENGLELPRHFGIMNLNEGNPDGHIGGMYNYGTGALDLNYDSFRRSYREANQTNWGVADAIGYGVAVTMHEFGHHLEGAVFKKKYRKSYKGRPRYFYIW